MVLTRIVIEFTTHPHENESSNMFDNRNQEFRNKVIPDAMKHLEEFFYQDKFRQHPDYSVTIYETAK